MEADRDPGTVRRLFNSISAAAACLIRATRINGNQFTGTLDEVAIWDVALGPEELQGIVNAALTSGSSFSQAVLDTGPLGYWRFDEVDGDVAVNQGLGGASLDGVNTSVASVAFRDRIKLRANRCPAWSRATSRIKWGPTKVTYRSRHHH